MSKSRVLNVRLTIATGTTASNTLLAWNTYGNSAGCIIQSPVTLPETVNIQISGDGGTTWTNYQEGSPLADLTVPAAGKSAPFDRLVMATAVRLLATANVAADRIFNFNFVSLY